MKMAKPHVCRCPTPRSPSSALQEAERGRNPHVFAGRPTKPLSNMSMTMLLRGA